MKIKYISLLMGMGLWCVFAEFATAQDTVKLEPSKYYLSSMWPVHDINFVFQLDRARELITFSETHKKVEYCYYYDQKRICFGEVYRLLDDSTMSIQRQGQNVVKWRFNKQKDGGYSIKHYGKNFIERGSASSLIPLVKKDTFQTTSLYARTVLWYEVFLPKQDPSNRKSYFIFPATKISGRILNTEQIDQNPNFRNGLSFNAMRMVDTVYYYNEPMYTVRNMVCIITKEGQIVNLRMGGGNYDHDHPYILELMKRMADYPSITPAMRGGKPVNVLWIIDIDQMDSYKNSRARHPAFDRTWLEMRTLCTNYINTAEER
ncbi:MAG: hypothetical protein ACI8ZN_001164 [Bacteroidia bacterium]